MRRMWTSRPLPGVTVLLAVSLVLANGCGDGEETTTTASAPATTVTTAAPTTTTAASVSTSVPVTETSSTTTVPSTTTTTIEELSSAETRLPNGDIKGMGFIDIVWEADGMRYLSIDYAEMLTGEEARQAAIEAGYIEPDEDLPNDYFIRNVSNQKREFAVADVVAITTSTRSGGPGEAATWEEFLSFWSGDPPEGAQHLHDMPWWIIRSGNEVYAIDEQYIP